MKLVTWNVNSLKARLPRVLEFVSEHAPDVLCLQETKCDPEAFPVAELADAGYASIHHSGGRWAGVAVVARAELAPVEVAAGLPGAPAADEARWVEAQVDGVHVVSTYVINGREVGSPWFADKLGFFAAMAQRAAALREAGAPFVIAGDLNVTRDDRDVYDPAAFDGATHVTPEEREALEALLVAGDLRDSFREVSEEVGFTWWDYRQGHFHRGLGLRIDYVLASAGLPVAGYEMVRPYRKGTKPSDHAPVMVTLLR